MTDERYDMRPVGRVDHETVDEMGLEAVLALKRERDALRAEVEHLRTEVRDMPRQYHGLIAALEAQVKQLLDPLVRARALQPVTMTIQLTPEQLDRLQSASWESSERASAYREAP